MFQRNNYTNRFKFLPWKDNGENCKCENRADFAYKYCGKRGAGGVRGNTFLPFWNFRNLTPVVKVNTGGMPPIMYMVRDLLGNMH